MFWFDYSWEIQNVLNAWWWPINFLLLAGLVVLAYVGFKKPVQAVAATIVLLPTYLVRSKISFIPLTYLELCIWITFISWAMRQVTTHQFNFDAVRRYRWPILLLIIGATIGIFVSPVKINASGLWKAYVVEPILFFIVVGSVCSETKNRPTVLWALGLSTLAISLLAIYQKFTGFGIAQPVWMAPAHRRVTAIFTSPNAVGLFLGPTIALYTAWIIAEWKNIWATIMKCILIILAAIAVAFSLSAGTALGLIAAFIFLAFHGLNKKIVIAIVLIILIVSLSIPFFQHQLTTIIASRDTSGENRLVLWRMAMDYLLSSPSHFVFGAGILGFAQIQNQLRDPLKMEPLLYPHNILLNFWVETGLLGLMAMIWILVLFFRRGAKLTTQNRWLSLGVMAAMITIIIHGMVDVPYFKNDLAVLFWTLIGLL